MITIEIENVEQAQSIANGLSSAIEMSAEYLPECELTDAQEVSDTIVWMRKIQEQLETEFGVCIGM